MAVKFWVSYRCFELFLVLCLLEYVQSDCPFPKEELKNGQYMHVSNKYAGKDIAPDLYVLKFKCFTGYERIGPRFIQCVDGQWSSAVPICKKIECLPPPKVANGTYKIRGGESKPLTVGTLVTYSCKAGFKLADFSASHIMCILNKEGNKGVWVGKMPVCQELKNCSDPGVSKNGSRSGDCCLAGSKLQFSCKEDFELVGEKEIVCLPSGLWSNRRPLCRPSTEVYCDLPPVIPHGVVIGEKEGDYFLPYNEAEIMCEPGYSYQGPSKYVMCMEDGLWEEEFGNCTEIYCDRPEPLENGSIPELESTDLLSYPYNFEITYVCDKGHRLLGGDSWRICRKNGWTGKTPYCKEIRCPDPGVPENGIREGSSFVVGAKIRFKCFTGYYLLGSFERYCMPNGQWSGELSKCDNSNNYCPNPGIPINGYKSSSNYDLGDIVKFSCQSGYIHVGSESRECLPNKKWSGTETKCSSPYDYDNTAEVGEILRSKVEEHFDEDIKEMKKYRSAIGPEGRILDLSYQGRLIIYFAFDVSGSVGQYHFKKSIEFAKAIVRKVRVSEHGTRIGAVTFSSRAENAFLPEHFNTTEGVLNALDDIQFTGGGTAASTALGKIRDNMRLNEENLKGPTQTKTVLFVITDGRANMGGSPEEEAKVLKKAGVDIYCIGITGDVRTESLFKIATTSQYSNEERPNVFILKDYKVLDWLIQQITNGTVDFSQCGIGMENVINFNRGRILDGEQSSEPWPWMAGLFSFKRHDIEEASIQILCGGSIINENFILTAAHCMYETVRKTRSYRVRAKDEILVKLGLTDLKDESKWTGVQEFNVKEMHIHPKYIRGPSFDYDIALLKLDRPIAFEAYIRPICLPPKELPPNSKLYSSSEYGWATGWGHEGFVPADHTSDTYTMSKNLKEIKLPIQSRERCRKSLEEKEYNTTYFTERMFCAGDGETGNDTCYGDSGGPLVQHQMNEEGQFYWTQVGIISWGHGCGVKDLYGYYTHVHSLLSWIEEKTQEMNMVIDDLVNP